MVTFSSAGSHFWIGGHIVSNMLYKDTKRNHPTGWFLYCPQNCADSKKEPDDKNRQTSFFIMQQDCFT